jgi:uncharacterized protein YceK
MKKLFIVCAVTFALTGCGKFAQLTAHYTGQASETCHDGIVYLQWTSGATVKIDSHTMLPEKCPK